ncbi:MAG: alpha/beta hydrolase family protein [Bacteroidota bacterium]
MKINFLVAIFLTFSLSVFSQEKLPLSTEVYEAWKEINDPKFSPDGRYLSWEVAPQKGDRILVIRDVKAEKNDTIERGSRAAFSLNSEYLVGMIEVPFDTLRAAKKAKKKEGEMPKDSLFIMDLNSGKIKKIANVRSFRLSEEGNNLLVYHHAFVEIKAKEENQDENEGEKDKSGLKKKHKLADLVVYDPEDKSSQRFENIAAYSLSKNGKLVGFHQMSTDTSLMSVVYALSFENNVLDICHEGNGIAKNLKVDDSGKKMAFLFADDSSKVAGFELHYWEIGKKNTEVLIDSMGSQLPGNMLVNMHAKIYFSGNSDRLYFGTSPMKEREPEDTLLEDERVSLDVWSWEDQLLQPMQKKQLEQEKKRTYLAYYDMQRKIPVQLADSVVRSVKTMHEGNGDVMLGYADAHYGKLISWEGLRYRDVYSIDAHSGEKRLLEKKITANISLSPFGNYLLYYSLTDSAWISIDISTGEKKNLTQDIEVSFYNEKHDLPQFPSSYGFAGFTENDEFVLIYDRYDIWKIDPSGKQAPVNLTGGKGRANKVYLRYKKLDEDEVCIKLDEPLYLSAFDSECMDDGYYLLKNGKLTELISSSHDYSHLIRAKKEEIFAFRRGNFEDFNDLYLAEGEKMNTVNQISETNPQQDNYLWGDVKLVSWLSFNGDQLKGRLYTPEDLDTTKKYPMLVYFYELSSEGIHRHRIPSPSRSIINPAFCTSNGYVVFVPDIIYRIGYPGQSAYDAVVSGTQAMVERYAFIDSKRMGLQGQSWGGYQIAWLITRTNLFAAAMAGAPVSNMTSAYGGIRWGTGMSRMFQYEKTQSRIGGTLWDELDLYLENSPLFHANRIETPVLIMHNDDDGAVPWYQGIEYFVALRRLNKPAWMLTYNNEAHNLKRWPNRIDLDIRMMQFFDHFLKSEPMPTWMKKGVPATHKNKVTGRELLR